MNMLNMYNLSSLRSGKRCGGLLSEPKNKGSDHQLVPWHNELFDSRRILKARIDLVPSAAV